MGAWGGSGERALGGASWPGGRRCQADTWNPELSQVRRVEIQAQGLGPHRVRCVRDCAVEGRAWKKRPQALLLSHLHKLAYELLPFFLDSVYQPGLDGVGGSRKGQ